MEFQEIKAKLEQAGDTHKALFMQRYFKTGPGEYGEGDIFLGIRVPDIRKLVGQHHSISLMDTEKLLMSKVHEQRLFAVLVLVKKYVKADEDGKKSIYDLYLKNSCHINSWDLVDVSAEHIVGAFLFKRSREPLYVLSRSENLWERRISIVSTFHFIKNGDLGDTVRIAETLLSDHEDLVHKASGWMLREAGKRNIQIVKDFIRKHYHSMPRTMLRYAIEKFPEQERKLYLKGIFDQVRS